MNVAGKPQEGRSAQAVDFDRFRLRRFIDEVAGMGELEIHADAIELLASPKSSKATPRPVVPCCRAGEAGTGRQRHGKPQPSRPRLRQDARHATCRNPAPPQDQTGDRRGVARRSAVSAGVRTGDDADRTKLPVHLQHGQDGAPYISSSIDYVIDPKAAPLLGEWRAAACARLSSRRASTSSTRCTPRPSPSRREPAPRARMDDFPGPSAARG